MVFVVVVIFGDLFTFFRLKVHGMLQVRFMLALVCNRITKIHSAMRKNLREQKESGQRTQVLVVITLCHNFNARTCCLDQ